MRSWYGWFKEHSDFAETILVVDDPSDHTTTAAPGARFCSSSGPNSGGRDLRRTLGTPPLPVDEESWNLSWIAVLDTKIIGMVLTGGECGASSGTFTGVLLDAERGIDFRCCGEQGIAETRAGN